MSTGEGRGPADGGRPSADPRLAAHLAGVEAVLFDIDHTLVDTATAFARALEASLIPMLRERRGGAPAMEPAEGAAAVIARATVGAGRDVAIEPAAVIARWSADPGDHYRRFTRGEVAYDTQRHARIDEIAHHLGLAPFSDAEYGDFSRSFDAAFVPACEPFADARPTLLRLREHGIAVGAVSNASRSLQERKLAAAGLADIVPLLVTVDTFGVGKPDPRVFREGAALLGVDPGRTAYVGDEPDVDAQAAAHAGLRGVLLRRPADERPLEHRELDRDLRKYCEVGDLTGVLAALALPTGMRTG